MMPAKGAWSGEPHTVSATRPPGRRIRRVSASAATLSGKNINPNWQMTMSNVPFPKGSIIASAAIKLTFFDVSDLEAATWSIGTEISTPITWPALSTLWPASRAASPVPVAKSKTELRDELLAASNSAGAYRRDHRPVRRSYAAAPASYFISPPMQEQHGQSNLTPALTGTERAKRTRGHQRAALVCPVERVVRPTHD